MLNASEQIHSEVKWLSDEGEKLLLQLSYRSGKIMAKWMQKKNYISFSKLKIIDKRRKNQNRPYFLYFFKKMGLNIAH